MASFLHTLTRLPHQGIVSTLISFDSIFTEVTCFSFYVQCSHKWKFLEKYIFMDAKQADIHCSGKLENNNGMYYTCSRV
jgi:hypothetical protein